MNMNTTSIRDGHSTRKSKIHIDSSYKTAIIAMVIAIVIAAKFIVMLTIARTSRILASVTTSWLSQ